MTLGQHVPGLFPKAFGSSRASKRPEKSKGAAERSVGCAQRPAKHGGRGERMAGRQDKPRLFCLFRRFFPGPQARCETPCQREPKSARCSKKLERRSVRETAGLTQV